MGIFDAIGIDAGIVLILVILIQLLLIIFLVKQSMKLARLSNKYKMFMRGKDAMSLEKAFEKKFEEVDSLTDTVKYQSDEIYKLKEIQKMTLNKTAIVKYDAFKDVGGKLSFALAMLDGNPTNKNYAVILLATAVATLPILIIFLIFQKQFVAGVMGGAVKE